MEWTWHELDQLLRAVPGARRETLPLATFLDRAAEAVRGGGRSLDEARAEVARLFRFASWDDVLRHGDTPVDPRFEAAADAIVDGDAAALRALLAADPALPRARSPFGHHATLLHYVAANGVEEIRQWQSPANAVEIARILLQAGAAVDAVCDCYGGGETTMTLLVSSAHPARAGVQAALVDLLVDHGAAVDGPAGDGAPLRTALAFGYLRAIEALVRRGARAEDLVAAAGLGRAAVVAARLAERPPPAEVETAFLRACAFGHRDVAHALVDHGVDLAARDAQGMTGLHLAAWRGHRQLVAELAARGAPLEAKNRYGGTVLDMTEWAAANAPFAGADYPAIIATLRAAGARPD